jgi:hypothetical protein
LGLWVDGFRETMGVIQKPLNGFLPRLSAFSGSALMGDGADNSEYPGDRLMPVEYKKNCAIFCDDVSVRDKGRRLGARSVPS